MQRLFVEIFWQVPDEIGIAFTGFVQLGAVTKGLVVSEERNSLSLLHLKPVHRRLKPTKSEKDDRVVVA